jgi:signal transduction histidine kinase
MGEMASSLAHELNQPLTAITNYAKGSISRLAQDQITKDNLRAVLEKMADQADRAAKIIKRIRAFVQKSTPNRESLSLGEVIENAVSFAEIEARKYRINIVFDDIDTKVRVLADGLLIEQVIFNLLKNAIDSMQLSPYQNIHISMKVLSEPYIQISIADQGHGIALEADEDVYMAFYTTKTGGMGMGLNICRSIIEIHNGRIWYEPNGEKGTIFHFTLPIDLSSIGAMDGTSDRIYY